MRIKQFSVRWLALSITLAATVGCAAKAPVRVAAIASLPAEITVREWPYWVDIPIQSTNVDRVWRTVIDVVGEKAAIRIMDREGGYLQTEWRSSDVRIGQYLTEERMTIRIKTSEGRIRMGIESRYRGTTNLTSALVNTAEAGWTSVYRELQQRLESGS
ncbi:MAG: hypothetical protein HYV19_07170 [Gemmatimonadetes bacterium]|nr:hypothetical protein [Gemmatimonadota bacterium]